MRFHDPCPRENGERNPPLTPPKRGIICAIIKLVLVKTGICGFKLNTDKVVETSQWVVSTFVRKDAKKAKAEKVES